MNREKKDKIPSMQVSFIDAICTQLYEVILPTLVSVQRFSHCQGVNVRFWTRWKNPIRFFFPVTLKSLSPFQTLAGMSEYCSPLLEGCQKNRQQWKHLAEECEKGLVNGLV